MRDLVHRLLVLSCLVQAGLSGTAVAGEAVALTWDDCVKSAIENNPGLKSARFQLDAARARRNSAFGGFLPRLSAGASGRDGGTGNNPDLADISPSSWSANVTVSQSLFSGFSTLNEAFAAVASVRKAAAALQAESASTRNRLRAAFLSLLHAQENVTLLENIAKRRRDNADLVRLRYEAGREDKGSALRVAADARSAAFEVSRTRRSLSLARRRLSAEAGLAGATGELAVSGQWEVTPPPESPDFMGLASRTPSIRTAEASLDEARASLRGDTSPFLPAADLSAGISRTGPDWMPGEKSWSAGISFSWSLFNGGRDASYFMAGLAAKRVAEANLDDARRSALVTLEDKWNAYADAYEYVGVSRQYLEASTTRAEIGRAQYANGLLSFTQWDLIESELVNSERGHLNARRDALLAESAWLNALGEGLGEKR